MTNIPGPRPAPGKMSTGDKRAWKDVQEILEKKDDEQDNDRK